MFVTLGSFSPDARTFEQTKPNLRLIDGAALIELIYEHYHQFEPRYQMLFPLKRSYTPALSFPPAIEPRCPALFGRPLLPVAFDPHDFEPVETCSDTFDHHGAINMPHDMAVRLKLPFPAAMNRMPELPWLPPQGPSSSTQLTAGGV